MSTTALEAPAYAKINLALAVGPLRPDGLHEVATILQRVDLADTIALEVSATLAVEGFHDDTLVRRALLAVAEAAGVSPSWRARIDKRIPVAAGLGGGSSDAAAAILLANELLGKALPGDVLHRIACGVGVDTAFFLAPGPQLGTGDGTILEPVELPQDYIVLLVLPHGETKPSTAEIYRRFDGEAGFPERREAILDVVRAGRSADLSSLPANDLARSPVAGRLRELGAFRADVSGAGPTVYGLFRDRVAAEAARDAVAALGEVWLANPAW